MTARRRGMAVVAVVAGLLVVLAGLVGVLVTDLLRSAGGTAPAVDAPAGDDRARPAPDGLGVQGRPATVPPDARPAVVTAVVDGDTLRVRFPDGDRDESRRRSLPVRLLNIDTPELGRDGRPPECLALEASRRTSRLVPVGSTVWLAADVEDRDGFDRLLRGVWTDGGVFVNGVLAAEGLAVSLHVAPNDRFLVRIRAAERAAARKRLGLWGGDC